MIEIGDIILCNHSGGPFTKGMYYLVQMVDTYGIRNGDYGDGGEFGVIDDDDMLNWMEYYPQEECESSYLMWFEDINITKRNIKLNELLDGEI